MDKTTFKRSFKLSLALFALLALAVGSVSAWEWLRAQRPPAREPDFRGRIVSTDGRLLVESPQGGRCWFFLPPGQRILRGGEPAQLRVGQQVSVWHDSEVYTSDPPGAQAQWIVIEDEPKGKPQ